MHILIRTILAPHCLVTFIPLGICGILALSLVKPFEDKVCKPTLHEVLVDVPQVASWLRFNNANVVDAT